MRVKRWTNIECGNTTKNSSNFPRRERGRNKIYEWCNGETSDCIPISEVFLFLHLPVLHLCIISFLVLFRFSPAFRCGLVEMGVKQPRQATKQKHTHTHTKNYSNTWKSKKCVHRTESHSKWVEPTWIWWIFVHALRPSFEDNVTSFSCVCQMSATLNYSHMLSLLFEINAAKRKIYRFTLHRTICGFLSSCDWRHCRSMLKK